MQPLLVLCLGNEVLTDDAFGPLVASRLDGQLPSEVEVLFAPVAGFRLIELLRERRAVLIVDAIQTADAPPGTLHYFPAGNLVPSNGLINSHQISLPTALSLGRELGERMPEDIQVLACEAGDIETLSEQPSDRVAAAVEPAIQVVLDWANRQLSATRTADGPNATVPC